MEKKYDSFKVMPIQLILLQFRLMGSDWLPVEERHNNQLGSAENTINNGN